MRITSPHSQQLHRLQATGFTLGSKELLHYQSQSKLLDLVPKVKINAQLSGGYISAVKGRGMEFDEARHYQPGDDIRAIDWRVTARTGKTHTKIYREERERPVFILCDFSRSMHFGTQLLYKSVQAAHYASLVSWNAIERGDKLGAIVFSDTEHREIKPKGRKKAVLSVFHALTEIHNHVSVKPDTSNATKESNNPLEQSLMKLRRLAKPGSLVCLISDFELFNETCSKYISDMRRHCEIQAANIFDPLEIAIPESAAGRTLSLQSEHSNQPVSLSSKASYHAYALEREKKQAWLKRALFPYVSQYSNISAGQSLIEQLNAHNKHLNQNQANAKTGMLP